MERGRKGREGERRKVEKKGLERETERIREQAVQSSVHLNQKSTLYLFYDENKGPSGPHRNIEREREWK